ncbi:MAG TPA: VWA domain-containing protein [Bryobacteraceae bacterium]|nr:VWA domain-containing protein [Bryobacteraceae bacterium]
MRIRNWLALLILGSFVGNMTSVSAQGPGPKSSETVARPRKKANPDAPEEKKEEPGDKVESKFKKKPDGELPVGLPTFKSDVSTVQVDVAVLDKNGRFIPNIPRGNFRVLEDGVPQQVSGYTLGEAPMTICMVIEFSNLYQQYWSSGWYETLQASYGFLDTLKPEDYVAIVAYDLRPEILSDFSTDKRKAQEGMQRLRIAAYSESNLYDALTDTADRMSEIEGRKAIVLIASGVDTFSKLTFDQTRKKIQQAGVPIYAIGIMQALREWMDSRGYMGSLQRLDFLQADNQMRTFARESGGQSFFPRFFGEFPNIYRGIHQALRNQYTLTYQPTNLAKDGKFRKITVQLVNPATNEPLRIVDEKGKPMKYSVVAKQGYNAPREVE